MSSISSSGLPAPDWRLSDVSSLCSLGPRPYLLTGALVQHLRAHFSTPANIEEPTLRTAVWMPSEPSGIVVESSTKWKPEKSGHRPAVLVRRNGFQPTPLGINDELQGYLDLQGNQYFCCPVRGSHTVFCIAGEAGEGERLACEVYRELLQFGPVLRKYLMLLRFKVADVGPLSRLQEAMGSYTVPITLAYAFEETWMLEPNAPKLRRILLTDLLDESI